MHIVHTQAHVFSTHVYLYSGNCICKRCLLGTGLPAFTHKSQGKNSLVRGQALYIYLAKMNANKFFPETDF